jgi:hypothetical protein
LSTREINVGRDGAAVRLDLLRDIYLADFEVQADLVSAPVAQNEASHLTDAVGSFDIP